jgi:2-polyprenyl-6-hydroxyphenyl methylase/3-demethylubiquinone-9 3-methyltransferase
MVKPQGLLYIAIYNDQGIISDIWRLIKKTYCSGPAGRRLMTRLFFPLFFCHGLITDARTFTNPFRRYLHDAKKERGMSEIHDWRDWLGGYPFEPASPTSIIAFHENLGFSFLKSKPPQNGLGNNEFLFRKG